MDIHKLTGIVVDLCIKIHSKIGPGCFERVYEELIYYELIKLGLKVQIRTHLSLLNLKHGMLLNFKEELMKDGIHRVFNNFGRESLSV